MLCRAVLPPIMRIKKIGDEIEQFSFSKNEACSLFIHREKNNHMKCSLFTKTIYTDKKFQIKMQFWNWVMTFWLLLRTILTVTFSWMKYPSTSGRMKYPSDLRPWNLNLSKVWVIASKADSSGLLARKAVIWMTLNKFNVIFIPF